MPTDVETERHTLNESLERDMASLLSPGSPESSLQQLSPSTAQFSPTSKTKTPRGVSNTGRIHFATSSPLSPAQLEPGSPLRRLLAPQPPSYGRVPSRASAVRPRVAKAGRTGIIKSNADRLVRSYEGSGPEAQDSAPRLKLNWSSARKGGALPLRHPPPPIWPT